MEVRFLLLLSISLSLIAINRLPYKKNYRDLYRFKILVKNYLNTRMKNVKSVVFINFLTTCKGYHIGILPTFSWGPFAVTLTKLLLSLRKFYNIIGKDINIIWKDIIILGLSYSWTRLTNNFSNKNFYETNYNYSYIFFFIVNFASFFFNVKSSIILINNLRQVLNKFDLFYLDTLEHSNKVVNFTFMSLFRISNFIEVLYLTLKFLDFSWLYDFIQNVLLKLSIFKHNFFFTQLFYLIKYKFSNLFNYFKIAGVFISLKGKIGVSGSSRKRRLFLNTGKTSFFNLKYKLYSQTSYLKTVSGSIGFKFFVFYY